MGSGRRAALDAAEGGEDVPTMGEFDFDDGDGDGAGDDRGADCGGDGGSADIGRVMDVRERKNGTKKVCSLAAAALAAAALIATASYRAGEYRGGGRPASAPAATDSGSFGGRGGWAPLPSPSSPLTRLAFGSCSLQTRPLPYLDTLAYLRPNVTILAGDNVYAACDPSKAAAGHACSGSSPDGSQYQGLAEAYGTLASHPSFIGAKGLLPTVATLDNHDYGLRDADETNPFKDEAKRMFLDFFGAGEEDERRGTDRENEGVYVSYEWGPAGRRVQVILLDTRYSRSPFLPTGNVSAPWRPYDVKDESAHMLSDAHWSYLERKLSEPAQVRIVVSSIQVMADGHSFECWRMIPRERDRLYATLAPATESSRVVLVSGDRHVGGFYAHPALDLHEVTASSWTHTLPLGAYSSCSTFLECDEDDPRRIGPFVRVNNFGTVEINWEKGEVLLSFNRAERDVDNSWKKGYGSAGEVLNSLSLKIPR